MPKSVYEAVVVILVGLVVAWIGWWVIHRTENAEKRTAAKANAAADGIASIAKQKRDILAFLAQWRLDVASAKVTADGESIKAAHEAKNGAFAALVKSCDAHWCSDSEFKRLVQNLACVLEPKGSLNLDAIKRVGAQAAKGEILTAIDKLVAHVEKA